MIATSMRRKHGSEPQSGDGAEARADSGPAQPSQPRFDLDDPAAHPQVLLPPTRCSGQEYGNHVSSARLCTTMPSYVT